jgi:uncharacterized damage-inducible protein DinB
MTPSAPISADLIRNHIAYSAWATQRLFDAAAPLSSEQLNRNFGTADKSILGTLVHIFRSERSWRLRIKEGTPAIPYKLPEDEQWAILLKQWPVIHQDWREWAAGLSDADSGRVVDYTDLKGNSWSQPLWHIVLHVVNHSTHHRGQVSGFIRVLGLTPPPLDFIAYMRQRAITP